MAIDFPNNLTGVPFLPVEFNKKARLVDDDQVKTVIEHVTSEGVTDLLVISHGWNNDESEAVELYQKLLASIKLQAGTRLDTRTVAVLGLFWPSKKFADQDLIPGGAASFDADLPKEALIAQIEALRGFFDADDSDDVLDE